MSKTIPRRVGIFCVWGSEAWGELIHRSSFKGANRLGVDVMVERSRRPSSMEVVGTEDIT
jgi:hypothetical protein